MEEGFIGRNTLGKLWLMCLERKKLLFTGINGVMGLLWVILCLPAWSPLLPLCAESPGLRFKPLYDCYIGQPKMLYKKCDFVFEVNLYADDAHTENNSNFFRGTTSHPRNLNILYFQSNTQHTEVISTYECVEKTHVFISGCSKRACGRGYADSPALSVAKLKSCLWTHTDRLDPLLCQLLTRRRKLQPWPCGACRVLWEVILLAQRRRGWGMYKVEPRVADLYEHHSPCSLEHGSSQQINIQHIEEFSWGMKGLQSKRVPAKANMEPYHWHSMVSFFLRAEVSFQINDEARPSKPNSNQIFSIIKQRSSLPMGNLLYICFLIKVPE